MRPVVAAVALVALSASLPADEKTGSVWESRKSGWEQLAEGQRDQVLRFAEDYKAYLSAARSAEGSTREVIRLAKRRVF